MANTSNIWIKTSPSTTLDRKELLLQLATSAAHAAKVAFNVALTLGTLAMMPFIGAFMVWMMFGVFIFERYGFAPKEPALVPLRNDWR